MKVSVNGSRAKDTAKHNDRSMYKNYKNEQAQPGHPGNEHWDRYKCGSSWQAEERYYNEHLGPALTAQNERARKNYKPELTMAEYHQRHMPMEMIIQLGNVDEPPKDDKYLRNVSKMVLQECKKVGIDPISMDLHNDEGTPHLHVRYVGLDAQGTVNLAGCLREHGILTPLEQACQVAGIDYNSIPTRTDKQGRVKLDPCANSKLAEKLEQVKPDLFSRGKNGKLAFKAKSNTALNAWTNDIIRERAEQIAENMGYEIDTIRSKRRHLDVGAYKTEQDRKKEEERLDRQREAEQKAEQATQQAQAAEERQKLAAAAAAAAEDRERIANDQLQKHGRVFFVKRRWIGEYAEKERAFAEEKAQHEQEHAEKMEQLDKREKRLDLRERDINGREKRLEDARTAFERDKDNYQEHIKKAAMELLEPYKTAYEKETSKAKGKKMQAEIDQAMKTIDVTPIWKQYEPSF